jgi:hypothetical protein
MFYLPEQKGNTTTDLKEIDRKDVEWIHVAQDRDQWRTLMNTVMNLQVP